MKRPNEEEFMELYEQYATNIEAIHEMALHYNVHERTVRFWIERYVHEIESDQEEEEEETEFQSMLESFSSSPFASTPYREAEVKLPKKNILVVCMSDTHLGSRFVDKKLLSRHINLIKNTEGVYFFHVGDVIDTGPVSSTHKDLQHDQIMPLKGAKQLAVAMFKEIGHKALAITSGCHGAWTYSETGEYFEAELAKLTLTKIFLEHGGFLNMKIGDKTIRVFMSHKIQGGGMLNPVRGIFRLSEMGADFQVGVGAHHHSPFVAQGRILAIKCGTYKHLDTYANKQGFMESELSIPGFFINAETGEITGFLNWEQGLKLLC